MSDATKIPAETPTNDGGTSGTNASPEETEPTEEQVTAETPVNQGGGSA